MVGPKKTATPDPFQAIEDAVKRQRQEVQAKETIEKAGIALLFGKRTFSETRSSDSVKNTCFWSALLLRMDKVARWDIETFATDGVKVYYNPEFACSLPPDEIIGVMVHEACHKLYCHHARVGGTFTEKANVAADLAINHLIKQSGFKLPSDGVFPGVRPNGKNFPKEWADAIAKAPKGLSMEEYMQLLPDRKRKPDGEGEGEGEKPGSDPGQCGSVIQPGDGSESARSEAEAKAHSDVAMAEAVARQRGELSEGLERLLGELLTPKVPWKDILREFLTRPSKSDYTWSRPNRRLIGQGIYLPGLHGMELGEVVLALDTSGSIGQEELQMMATEVQGIIEAYEVELTILYHNSDVYRVQRWKPSDGPLQLEEIQSGGTSHLPVFQRVDEEGLQPTCMVCLTDMYSEFPQTPPDYPVLWASIVKGSEVPFGQLVEIDG